MRRDTHILDRAFDRMLGRAKAVYRTLGMLIGVDQAHAGKTTRGLFA